MNILNRLNYVNTPTDLMSVLKLALDGFGQDLNCVRVGIIQEFIYKEQIVRVKIASQRLINVNKDGSQTTEDYAEIYAKLCYASPFHLFPPKVGDECVLLFNDREMESWWINGSANQRAYNRMHDLTDCIAICGLRSQPKLVNIFTNLIEIFYDTLLKTDIKILTDKIITKTENLISYIEKKIFSKCENVEKIVTEKTEEYHKEAVIVCPDLTISGGSYEFEHQDVINEETNTYNIDDTTTITSSKTGDIKVKFGTIAIEANTTLTINATTSTSITSTNISLNAIVAANHVDVADGASGIFTSADGKVITVNNGIVVRIQ